MWMLTVFKPSHEEMMGLITKNADLLIGSHLPKALQLFCAHVAAYKVVFKKWEAGDFSGHVSVIDYPADEMQEYLSSSFEWLKREQSRLLGRGRSKSGKPFEG